MTKAANATTKKRVLLLGRMQSVIDGVRQELEALGISVQGSTDAERAADQFDARDFDLIVFGSGLVGLVSDQLRLEFSRQNPDIRFLEAFAPVAIKQIVSALGDDGPEHRYASDFRAVENGQDLLVRATILQPCSARTKVYRIAGAFLDGEVVEDSTAEPGTFERRIDARHHKDGWVLMLALNDEEFHVLRLSDGRILE